MEKQQIRVAITVYVVSENDKLAETVRAAGLSERIRIERLGSVPEMRHRLLNYAQPPHEVDLSNASIVVLDDDIYMEGRPALLPELAALRPGLKLIWVADRLDRGREIEARRLGIYFILSRPLEPTLLSRVIETAVEHETTRVRRMSI